MLTGSNTCFVVVVCVCVWKVVQISAALIWQKTVTLNKLIKNVVTFFSLTIIICNVLTLSKACIFANVLLFQSFIQF